MIEDIISLPFVELPSETESLRHDVRAFLQHRLRDLPAEQRARTWIGYDAEFSRDLAAMGWVGITLPTKYGGGGKSAFDRFVLMEELLSAGAPVSSHWIAERQSAPLLLRYGTEEQRQKFIPEICAGRHTFCVGLSEPDVGSDLAGTQSTARKNGKAWILNGTKLWTTNGHRAQTMIGLFRTSSLDSDRRSGLSQFIIDLSLPGISRRPIMDVAGDNEFSEIHFDNVSIDEGNLLGELGQGWEQVTSELAFERSGPERLLSCNVLVDQWLDYLRSCGDPTDIELKLIGDFVSQLWTLRNMSLSVTATLAAGEDPVLEASIVKDLGTTFEQSVPEAIADSLARRSYRDVPAGLRGALNFVLSMYPAFSLRGGTREIMRGIIARGMGLR